MNKEPKCLIIGWFAGARASCTPPWGRSCFSLRPPFHFRARGAMDRFRALEGTWVSTYDMPEWPPQEVHYETIAADSAVVETIFDGQPHEMMTVFHLDGEELHCTHYCAAQNQPRLIAETITSDRVVFATADVSNLASPDAMYMGAAEFTFIDEDHIEVSWTSFEHGKQGETIHVTSERKK